VKHSHALEQLGRPFNLSPLSERAMPLPLVGDQRRPVRYALPRNGPVT
jgi:hypothetical protein